MTKTGLCALAILMACSGEKGGDDTETPSSPCADGSWGDLASPASAIQVRADGDDSADGSLDAPVATLDAALAISRARSSDKTIFVGPGSYTVTDLTLAEEVGDGTTDHGLTIDACADEVTLEAGDPDNPVLRVSAATDVSLARMTLSGGTRTLFIWKAASVFLKKLSVRAGGVAGVVIGGHETLVEGEDVDVEGDDDSEAPGGFGIGISSATVRFTGLRVRKARVAGIFVDSDGRGGDLTLDQVEVEGTTAETDGTYGRGLHVQDAIHVAVTDSSFTDNQDAGVFALQATALTMDGVTVDGVASGTVPDSEDSSGDGIVITSVDDSGDLFDPAGFALSLTSSVISGHTRAGVVVEGVTAEMSGNSVSADGLYAELAQGDAIVTGSDTVDIAAEALPLNRKALDGTALLPTE